MSTSKNKYNTAIDRIESEFYRVSSTVRKLKSFASNKFIVYLELEILSIDVSLFIEKQRTEQINMFVDI